MKKLFLRSSVVIFFALLLPVSLHATNSEHEHAGIHFTDISWQEALKLAETEGKLIFIDFYAEWCGRCKRMKQNTFPDAELGSLFNQKFINLSVDAEKGEGKTLAEQYNVKRFPTLLFVNHEGEVVGNATGFQNSRKLTELGQSVLVP
jgi:thioredoxin 1